MLERRATSSPSLNRLLLIIRTWPPTESTLLIILLPTSTTSLHLTEPDEFKTISLVIDTSSSERPTLIVHVDGKEAEALSDDVEEFLTEYDAYTQREYYSETDIRVLATLD